MRVTRLLLAFAFVSLAAPAFAAVSEHFESPPVHPIELSPSGNLLFAVHTADHHLVVFDVRGAVPVRLAEIPVGLEPVTVRARTEDEVWVVNHVSDSISVVDLPTGRIVRTLLVGDEPTDLEFAGSPERAFVVLSQEDRLVVIDPADPEGPRPEIALQGSDPRSVALSPDGSTLYVTIHDSGNETTAIPFATVDALGGPPAPDPPLAPGLPQPPRVALIVRHDGSSWLDEAGGNWDAALGYTLLDHDVIAIDVDTRLVVDAFTGVGTTLFNVGVNPTTGALVVTNQEAFNEIRFEPKLKGIFAQNRVTMIDPIGGTVSPRHLNGHITPGVPSGPALRAQSLSTPLDVVVASTGESFVAAFGSELVGVLNAAGDVTRTIAVGKGPAGLALDEAGSRLFVWERFESRVSVVDLTDDSVESVALGFDPTPPDVRDGRAVFYAARDGSMHGDLSCASCHVFGGMDNLSWDLGDPTGELMPPAPEGNPFNNLPMFHPMKGPMTTQALKGISGTEPLHWRGDRSTLSDFNGAFVSLMGAESELSPGDLALFETFVMSMQYPSNPFQELDGALPTNLNGGNAQVGEQAYLTGNLVGGLQCVTCHTLPTGENGVIIPGPLLAEDEGKVVPQLRNMYEKTRFDDTASTNVRGFGFTHDGAVDDLMTFLEFPAFTFVNVQQRLDVAAFLLAFDTGTPPAVGAQWTADGTNGGQSTRLTILQAQADAGRIDLIAKALDPLGEPTGWTYAGAGTWTIDRELEGAWTTAQLLALAGPGTEVTFTGVLTGEGQRMGVDRDEDGFLDGDERAAGSDPGDPDSTPDNVGTPAPDPVFATGPSLWMAGPNPASASTRFGFRAGAGEAAKLEIYDVRGRRVRALYRGEAPAERVVGWDLRDERGREVVSGLYFARLTVSGASSTQRVAVVR